MPFVIAELESALISLINNPPGTPRETAKVIANGYAKYAKPALGVGVPAVFTGLEAGKMANTMAKGFNKNGNVGLASNSMAAGILAFWLAPPIAFGPNLTVSWSGFSVMTACLGGMISTKISGPQAARKIARCIDSATRLVLVQPAVPGPPVPIA